MRSKLNILQLPVLSGLIFLVPSNWFLVLAESGFAHGLRIDYLLIRLWVVTLVAMVTAALGLAHLRSFSFSRVQALWLSTWILVLATQFLSPNPILGAWHWFQLSIAFGVAWSISQLSPQTIQTWVRPALGLTVLFQSSIAIYHVIFQQSVGGYRFLGETNLSAGINVAAINWFGASRVLPYGTTAHPNILGGVLAVYLILWLLLKPRDTDIRWWESVITIITGSALFLTQSISAWMTLAIGLAILILKVPDRVRTRVSGISLTAIVLIPVMIWLGHTLWNHPSVTRRAALQSAAIETTNTHLLTGTGLSQFTRVVSSQPFTGEVVRFAQPVHHVVFLWLGETGLVGLVWLLLSLHLLWRKSRWVLVPWAALLAPIIALDHYLISLPSGMFLLAVSWGVVATRLRRE